MKKMLWAIGVAALLLVGCRDSEIDEIEEDNIEIEDTTEEVDDTENEN